MSDIKWITKTFETNLSKSYQSEHYETDKETFDLDMQQHLAHVIMLTRQKIISKEDSIKILSALNKLWEGGPDLIKIRPGRVDLFSNLEDWLVDEIGIDIGGKFHIGRSRNDLDCNRSRMICRAYTIDFSLAVCQLIQELLDKSIKHIETVMPGYTHHSQHAQPTTMSHYLLWGVDNFLRDMDRAEEYYNRVNQSSLGGAALCSTGFPIDREYVATLLGFKGVVEHSIDASGSRDFMLEMGNLFSIFQSNLNRLTELLLVWNIREIGIIKIAREHCSYSSIMPQKVNPVCIEMLRNAASVTYGNLTSMFITLKGTTPGNGREPGYLNSFIMSIIKNTIPAAVYTGDIVKKMYIDKERCLVLAKEGFSTMTELADDMVRLKGLSFYMAHKIVARITQIAIEQNIPCVNITSSLVDEVASELFDRKIGFTNKEVQNALDPIKNVKNRNIMGGPSFKEAKRMIKVRSRELVRRKRTWEIKKMFQQKKIQEVKELSQQITESQ